MAHHVAQMASRNEEGISGFDRRVRIASEVATWGTAVLLVASAALPTTASGARAGLLFCAALLAIFGALWFHALPERIFGRMQFLVGSCVSQVIAGALLVLTDDVASPYFVFYYFPTLATTFAMRLSVTVATGVIATIVFLTVIVLDYLTAGLSEGELELGAIRMTSLVATIGLAGLITKTMQDTRATLRQRSVDLEARNVELEVARAAALALPRGRDLSDIVRAILDLSRPVLGIHRVFFFTGTETMADGFTVSVDSAPEPFTADPTLRDSPRQRAVRSRRTVVINDSAQDRGLSERVRTQFELGAALFLPLLHRGDLVGLLVLSASSARDWTPAEIKLGEVIADSAAPSLAAYLALEEIRDQREQLASRMKVLEGMNQLVEALSLAGDEKATAEVAARSAAQAFRLVAATTLVTDPSVALLEPTGIAGGASAHPVVNGPMTCPAIRSGRIFRVASQADPVICPYMPFKEGSHGYACAPLVAGGEPVGALFLEPAADSIVEDTFMVAAADRIALAIANRRVLETAQRQATTDGLTGLHNRHFLQDQLRLLHSLASRHEQSYAAIAIDVDGLKQVNDTFGHEMGDLALRGFANLLKRTARTSDVGVRTGGDEFLVLLPRGTLDDARILAERIREAVATQGRAEPHTAITVSLGVAAWRPGRTAEQVLEAADSMLYAAKRAGKDRVMAEAPVATADA